MCFWLSPNSHIGLVSSELRFLPFCFRFRSYSLRSFLFVRPVPISLPVSFIQAFLNSAFFSSTFASVFTCFVLSSCLLSSAFASDFFIRFLPLRFPTLISLRVLPFWLSCPLTYFRFLLSGVSPSLCSASISLCFPLFWLFPSVPLRFLFVFLPVFRIIHLLSGFLFLSLAS